jgi:hypothetical protein
MQHRKFCIETLILAKDNYVISSTNLQNNSVGAILINSCALFTHDA